ncbi:MAG: tetraacyldisaccharide 4'-kinase, partial [Chlamydiota bacterium]
MEHIFWALWKSSSPLSFLIRLIIKPLSWPFSLGSRLYHKFYDNNLFKIYESPLKVISVGNITVGGTGKTPFVLALAEQLEKKIPLAIITRGYRSPAEHKGLVIKKGDTDIAQAGDEAMFLFQGLQNPLICVGKDRIASLKKAEALGAKLAILEDGFQKRAIKRLLDIVLLDAVEPWGCKAFLPSGFLRDHLASLKRADFIVVPQSFNPEQVEFLRNFTKAPIIYTSNSYEIALERELPIALFAGIAAPQRFLAATKSLGFSVVYTKWLPDHATLNKELLARIWSE